MKFSSRSVLPDSSSLLICSCDISCCSIILPVRKSHFFLGPTACYHTKFIPCSYTLPLHLGHVPNEVWSEKSTGSVSSSSFCPKSNSSLCSSLIRKTAANGRPILLINPVSGPISLSLSRASASCISKVLPPGYLLIEKSQLVHAKRL